MHLIRSPLPTEVPLPQEVRLEVDRHALAKRRWRAQANDGRDFGFDLEAPLTHGQRFFMAGEVGYVIAQKPEPVLQLQLGDPSHAAHIGWLIGNLHFPLAVRNGSVLAPDDSALRQMLTREGIAFEVIEAVFQPACAGQPHQH